MRLFFVFATFLSISSSVWAGDLNRTLESEIARCTSQGPGCIEKTFFNLQSDLQSSLAKFCAKDSFNLWAAETDERCMIKAAREGGGFQFRERLLSCSIVKYAEFLALLRGESLRQEVVSYFMDPSTSQLLELNVLMRDLMNRERISCGGAGQ